MRIMVDDKAVYDEDKAVYNNDTASDIPTADEIKVHYLALISSIKFLSIRMTRYLTFY